MIPKPCIKIHKAILCALGSDPKGRAAGYNHTYVDNTGINIPILSVYPSDQDIQDMAEQAAQEADSLIALLGLTPSQLHRIWERQSMTAFPSITSWFQEAPGKDADTASVSDFSDDGLDNKSPSETQELQNLLDNEEDKSLSQTQKQEEQLLNLTCAVMAVVVDEAIKV
jgi:hypothetical protein